jgi:hypothetical protein
MLASQRPARWQVTISDASDRTATAVAMPAYSVVATLRRASVGPAKPFAVVRRLRPECGVMVAFRLEGLLPVAWRWRRSSWWVPSLRG